MFGTNVATKINFLKHAIGDAGLKRISGLKLHKKYGNICFYSSSSSNLTVHIFEPLPVNRHRNTIKFPALRNISVQATECKLKQENDHYLDQLFRARKIQAQRSVLLDVTKKEYIPSAVAHCEKYGSIDNAFSYSGKNENCFLLLEFSSETAARKLLSNCKYDNTADAFPVCSRLIRYEKKSEVDLSQVKINEESLLKTSLKSGASVSEFLEDIYHTEKLSDLDTRLRYLFCALIEDSISGLFPYCDAVPFGSSVNGLGKQGCDLDVMLRLYPKQVNQNSDLLFLNKTCVGNHKKFQQKIVKCLREIFQTFFPAISYVSTVIHARVPIIKMDHRILNINCDVSVNNLSTVYMSNVIHFCGEIDTRIRPLISTVKKWAKEADITKSNPGLYISNFGLTNLVIFFLQSRPHPILPPLNDVLQIVGEDNSFDFHVQYLKSIEELRSIASINKEPLAVLLKEFLLFLATNSFEEYTICLLSGKQNLRPLIKDALCLRYIFEESLNITKNVSVSELGRMCEIARISAKVLESNLEHKVDSSTDFRKLLGISSKDKMDAKMPEIDVNSIVEDKFSKKRAHVYTPEMF